MNDVLLKLPAVQEKTQLKKSSIYGFMKENKFPKPIKLGARAVAWKSAEIDAWIQGRAELRAG